ncbi:MAG: hypothetical protein QW318_07745 [Candidatus Caldarchaeum sp.]
MSGVVDTVEIRFIEDLIFYLSKVSELQDYFIDRVRRDSNLLLFSDVEERIHPFLKSDLVSVRLEVRRRERPCSVILSGLPKCATASYVYTVGLSTGDMPVELAEKIETAFSPAQEAFTKLNILNRSYDIDTNLRCYMNSVPHFAQRFSIAYKPYSRARRAPYGVVTELKEILRLHNFYQTFRDLSK